MLYIKRIKSKRTGRDRYQGYIPQYEAIENRNGTVIARRVPTRQGYYQWSDSLSEIYRWGDEKGEYWYKFTGEKGDGKRIPKKYRRRHRIFNTEVQSKMIDVYKRLAW